MKWLDGLYSRRSVHPNSEALDPERLRCLLFEAATAGDSDRLAALCRTHADMVLQHFNDWHRLPEAIADDRAAMQQYVHGLAWVAEYFRDALGQPSLFEGLTGPADSNPVLRWQKELNRAREFMQNLCYREATELLTNLLIDVRKLKGSAVDIYLPMTYGYLGESYFYGGEPGEARAPMQRALELCEQQGDTVCVTIYLENLYELHRYLGEPEPAAGFAERLADAFTRSGRMDDADWYRKQARLVRKGEPLNRVIAVIDGRRFEIDEAPSFRDGSVQFMFERNRLSLQGSQIWTQRGEEHGNAGRYEEALAAFQEASRADPFDPNPRYLAGLSLLHLQRAAEAIEQYRETEALAPGWFYCRASLWLAQQIVLGKLDHGTFLALRLLEDDPLPPDEKVQLADEELARYPDLSLVHLYRGKNLVTLERTAEAEAAYRRGLECATEPDVRTRLLLELGAALQTGESRRQLLEEAVQLNGNLVFAAMAALTLRRT